MYVDLLKQLYCKERKKLEEMEVFKQEGKLRLLKLRREMTSEIEEHLKIPVILGRTDIPEETKDNFIRDNEDKIHEHIEKLIDEELTDVENGEKDELRNVRYSPSEYAEYLYQQERVQALEAELGACRLFPDEVYYEFNRIAEAK
ncbi:MAG: hypothetical protein NTZ92_03015 [Candidatus Omnitrophica bacterium]|nr:hypothetical protein [Candidatus Omnitrophota bacterium]